MDQGRSPAPDDSAALVATALATAALHPEELSRLGAIVATDESIAEVPALDEAQLAGGDPASRPPESRDQDLQLARAASSGDDDAWREIVQRHSSSVKRMLAASRFANDREDLLQEIFVKVFSGLPSYQGLASLNTWILRITQYHLANHARKHRPRLDHELLESDLGGGEDFSLAETTPDREPSPLDSYRESERQRLAVRIFRQVDEPYRLAIVMTQLCGVSYEDTARILGIAEGTVKSRVSRGRAIIAAKMKDAGFD